MRHFSASKTRTPLLQLELPIHDGPGFTLRQLQITDHYWLLQECYQHLPRPKRRKSLRHALAAEARRQCAILAIERQQERVGAVQLFLLPGAIEIANLAVSAPYRRQGIAARTLRLIQEAMPLAGRGKLVLQVARQNLPARCLYSQQRFHVMQNHVNAPVLSMMWETESR